MIAKVIAHGVDRDQARSRLHDLVTQTVVWPVRTNASFLAKALEHPAFGSGQVDTGLIGRDGDELAASPTPSRVALSFAAEELVPEQEQLGFRLNAAPKETGWFSLDHLPIEVPFRVDEAELASARFIHVSRTARGSVLVSEYGQTWELTAWHQDGGESSKVHDGALLAPMPGKVTSVDVAAGEQVAKGQRLLTLEAMKMEHGMVAPFDGVVAELNVEAGAQVQVEAVLARVEATQE
jgi:3-methylcrotonyl-CoA carboxylase alpha subunit